MNIVFITRQDKENFVELFSENGKILEKKKDVEILTAQSINRERTSAGGSRHESYFPNKEYRYFAKRSYA